MFESKIVKIAEFVFENHQKVSQQEVIDKFGQKDFDHFRLVFGSEYADNIDVGGKVCLRLNSKGANLYLELKGKEQQDFFNKVLTIATTVLAFVAIVQTIKIFIG